MTAQSAEAQPTASSGAVLARGSEWVATPTSSASFRTHVLLPGTNTALCGERRQRWEPLSWFARPDVFTRCPACLNRLPKEPTP